MIRLKVQETSQRFRIITETPVNFNVESGIPLYPEEYTGSYEVTPSETEQTLETEGLMMTDDVTIGAIQTETKSVNPTESAQTVTHTSGKYMTEVTVGAIDSEYVGSDVPRRDETDLSASGATVTVPAGYYAEQKTKSVANGTAGIPTATKGAVSNHSISVTPSVTNTSGYITGSTKTGTAVTVSASELVSGNKDITQSGSTDVTDYATATVPEASFYTSVDNGQFYTDDGLRYYKTTAFTEIDPNEGDNAGWIGEGHYNGQTATFRAVPSGTTVTPSASSQTVGGTNYMMEGAVTVSAMPEADLRAILIPSSDFHAVSFETDYTIDSNGEETMFCTGGGLADFVYQAGYVGTDTQADIGFYFNDTHQLPTYSGAVTVTPSNQTQTLSTKDKYLLNNITVNQIPSQYIVPSGTYTVDSSGTKDVTNYASASVPSGTAGTPALTVSAVENHSKTIRSSVINQTGWITGGTVSGASTTVSASDLVSGSETKTANGTYDVTNLAEVVVDVSSSQPTLVKYAIRPDATLVQKYTYDKYLHADESITIPGYSTSAQTVKASSAIGTITLDRDNYYYYIVERMLTIPTYSVTTHNKGRCEYHMGVHAYEVIDIPGSSFHSLIEPTRYYTSRLNTVSTVMSSYREVYYSAQTTLSTYSTQAYGVCQAAVAPTISSGTLTINSPTVTERGSTSYFVNTYANAVTDIRAQYVIEVYKAPKNNLNYDGWSNDQLMKQVIDGINSNTHTLT